MQQAAVKKQRVSLIQFGGKASLKDSAVLLEIFAQEKRVVEVMA